MFLFSFPVFVVVSFFALLIVVFLGRLRLGFPSPSSVSPSLDSPGHQFCHHVVIICVLFKSLAIFFIVMVLIQLSSVIVLVVIL